MYLVVFEVNRGVSVSIIVPDNKLNDCISTNASRGLTLTNLITVFCKRNSIEEVNALALRVSSRIYLPD